MMEAIVVALLKCQKVHISNDDVTGKQVSVCPQPSYETLTEKIKIVPFYHEH